MEVFAIIIGIAIIVVLLCGIKLIKVDLEAKEKTIEKLVDENINLLEKNYKLLKKIRTNGKI